MTKEDEKLKINKDFKKYEKEIIRIFKQELVRQDKRPVNLSKEQNNKSTIIYSKITNIFNNKHRLAFADFMQLCYLLDLEPDKVIKQALNTPMKPTFADMQGIKLKDMKNIKISDLEDFTFKDFITLIKNIENERNQNI